MTRKLAVTAAMISLVLITLYACEPGRTEDRDCPAWYNQNACKSVGDDCSEIAKQFSKDDGVTSRTIGGKCVALNGKPVCAPIRDNIGQCAAVIECTYDRTDIYSCYAECTYAWGSGQGANGSYQCDFDHCKPWYDQNVCTTLDADCTPLATRFTYDGKTYAGKCANVTDPISLKTQLTCIPYRSDSSVCKGVVQCTWGTEMNECTPSCSYVYGKGTGAGQPCSFAHCKDWYAKNKCVKDGDDCSTLAAYFLNGDGKTTGGICATYNSKVVCVPVRSEAGFCQAIQDCPYGKGDELCDPKCTLIQGYTAAPGNCVLP
jgi:hypothetical protein